MHLGKIVASLLASASLAACATPFAGSTDYERTVRNTPGTVTLSDPKLYTREALINERARDIAWIDRLIVASEDPKTLFKPEIYREVEQISAFAAALGLNFDPAAGRAYRDDRETGKLQQEIDVMKLQLQLDQLRRDAEILRGKFAGQTEPVNADLGTVGDGAGGSADGPAGVTSADQLKTAVDALITALGNRFGAEVKGPSPTDVTASPFDDFRDRTAYRDMLKSARNAASLDQLHDIANAELIRLNFQASILPDEKNRRALGAVQIKVLDGGGAADADFLWGWLRHINRHPSLRSGAQLSNSDIVTGLEAGGFRRVDLAGVELLLPVTLDAAGTAEDPLTMLQRAQWTKDEKLDHDDFQGSLTLLSDPNPAVRQAVVAGLCGGAMDDNALRVERTLYLAAAREATHGFYAMAVPLAQDLSLAPINIQFAAKQARAANLRTQVVDRMRTFPDCAERAKAWALAAAPRWKALDIPGLGPSGVRIYEVGPREQVQQVSTVARSAQSLALAAAVAASAPGSGVSGNAAMSYSRQAMGRASTLERVPSVVGYSVAGEKTFGWVLGPRAIVNPRGKLEMEQLLKPYDLAVDLSVPGWWSYVELEVTTAWAPSPAMLASGKLALEDGPGPRSIKVPLNTNADRFIAFTESILPRSIQTPSIIDVRGGPINACGKSTLFLPGHHLWRADRVLVLGNLLNADAISIAPDMQGIFVTVPPIAPLPGVNLDETIYVMTPSGTAAHAVPYVGQPSGEACKGGARQAAATPPDTPAIASISPDLEFSLPGSFRIAVTGTHLDKVDRVELHAQPGLIKQGKEGKSLTVAFDEAATSSIPASDNVKLVFFANDKDVDTKRVRISR